MAESSDRNKPLTTRHFTLPGNSRAGRIIVLTIALAACTWTIHYWLLNFNDVVNDSACYINAADNLARSGKLVDFANWVFTNPAPAPDPYTEWAPGTPLFLAPFILVFHDPMLSVIIAQSILIVLVYAALVAFASVIDLNAVLTVALLSIFAFFHPFIFSATQYASETPFFITSLMAGYYAVKIARDGPSKKYWVMSLLFTFLASSVRFTGVANVGWYVPLLGPRLVLKKVSGDPATNLIRRVILIASILMLAGSIWIDEIGFFVEYEVHLLHFILLITGCFGLILGFGLLPGIEWKTVHTDDVAQNEWISHINFLRLLVIAAAFGPVLLWFARNELTYGIITRSHRLFREFNVQGIVEAPQILWFYFLQNQLFHQTVSFVTLMLLGLVPLIIGRKMERTIGLMLFSATLFQVATMWGSSIFAMFAYLNGRLLSPAILIATMTVLYGLGVLYRSNAGSRIRFILLLLPFLFVATNKHTDFMGPDLFSWKVRFPKEMYLWQQIHKMKWTLKSSQVYTEIDYRHQMFTDIPQEIYWNTEILRHPDLLKKLFSEGDRPFLVFPENSHENKLIRTTIDRYSLALDSVDYPALGYVLYYEGTSGQDREGVEGKKDSEKQR